MATPAPDSLFETIFALFNRGGMVMWPLLLCSLTGISVAISRISAFWRYNTANAFFRKRQLEISELTRQGRFDEACQKAQKCDCAHGRILASALANREAGFLETLSAASHHELDLLGRGLSILDTCITVAPMLGILGTVTGIISTFNLLNAAGIEDPTGPIAGIAEALITTAAGLIIAITCLFPFNFLVSQLRRRTHELEQLTHHFEVAYNSGKAHHNPAPGNASPKV